MNKQEFAKIVQAWADGETIQVTCTNTRWEDLDDYECPEWECVTEVSATYRIKPKETTTMIFAYAHPHFAFKYSKMQNDIHNIKLLFTDNVLTKAEVIK